VLLCCCVAFACALAFEKWKISDERVHSRVLTNILLATRYGAMICSITNDALRADFDDAAEIVSLLLFKLQLSAFHQAPRQALSSSLSVLYQSSIIFSLSLFRCANTRSFGKVFQALSTARCRSSLKICSLIPMIRTMTLSAGKHS
jgi:hypothetical protein